MANPIVISLKASGAESTNTAGTARDISYAGPAALYVNVTAFTGTGRRLGIYVEGRNNSTQTFFPMVDGNGNLLRTSAISTTNAGHSGIATFGGSVLQIPMTMPQMRIRSSFGGTSPSATYSADLIVAQ